MDIATFRQQYPAFVNTTDYPDTVVQRWLDMAESRLKPEFWQDTLEQGIGLFTAHNLLASKNAASGQQQAPGLLSSVSFSGSVTHSYDYQFVAIKNKGFWNLTAYGQQFAYYADMVGRCAPSQFYGA